MTAQDQEQLERSLLKRGDDVDSLFRDFKWSLLSRHKSMFVDIEAYDRVFNRQEFSATDTEANSVNFVSMLKPTLFEGAILLGANIEDSILYHWMTTHHRCRFEKHSEITSRLRPSRSDGHRLKLYYFFDGDTRSSKYRFNCQTPDGGTVIDEIDRRAVGKFGSDKFLYVSNNDRKSELLANHVNAVKMAVDTRGLNAYSSFNNIYAAFALNRKPPHIKVLNDLGLSSDLIYQATTCEQIYQSICRTSLRDPKADSEVIAIVPDLTTARYCQRQFEGASITKLPLSYVGKPKPFTKTEKKRRYRADLARNKLIASKRVPEFST